MAKVYTIREAIGELDAIRMDASTIAKKRDKELAVLVSELASVMGWLARHLDEFEAETISEILFDTDDGPVRKLELFEVDNSGGIKMEYKNYIKKAVQPMRPYIPGEDLTGISVSSEDTPEEGGMIAMNPKNPADKWYIAKDFFQKNYVEADNL